jgi:crossover junction endodeoxyribonuclease RuvC
MRVLGFDPGTATTGYGIIEGKGNRLTHIAHGVILTSPKEHYAERLKQIYDQATELIATHNPQAIAIEELFFTKNVSTGIPVAQARGVLSLAAIQSGLPIGEFKPREMKLAVAGYGKADKKQVQEMIKMLLNLDSIPKPDDAADALGIAICQIHTGQYNAVTGK